MNLRVPTKFSNEKNMYFWLRQFSQALSDIVEATLIVMGPLPLPPRRASTNTAVDRDKQASFHERNHELAMFAAESLGCLEVEVQAGFRGLCLSCTSSVRRIGILGNRP